MLRGLLYVCLALVVVLLIFWVFTSSPLMIKVEDMLFEIATFILRHREE